MKQNNLDNIYKLAEVVHSLTVDGEEQDVVHVGDEVNFTVSTPVADAEIYIDSCVAFNLDDSSDPSYNSLELVKNGCMPNSSDTIFTFVNPQLASTGTSFTFNQFAFVDGTLKVCV